MVCVCVWIAHLPIYVASDWFEGMLAMLWIFTAFLIECVSNTFSQAVIYVFMFWFIYGAFHSTVLFCFVKFLCRPICHTFLFFFWPLGLPPNLERPQDIDIEIQRSRLKHMMCVFCLALQHYMWDYLYTCIREGWQLSLYVLHIHSPILSFNLLIFYI